MSPKLAKYKSEYGAAADFMKRFNPGIQKGLMRAKAGYVECKKYDYPTIEQVAQMYSERASTLWLKIQLDDLNDYCGVKTKMEPEQLEDLANIILYNFGGYNIAEIALFITKIKAGEFGEFYGVVDPMRISTALQQFAAERQRQLTAEGRRQKEIEDQQKRETWSKTCITYEEYRERKRQAAKAKAPNITFKTITRKNRRNGNV